MLGVPIAVWSLLLYLLTGHLNKTQVFILVFSNQIEDEQFYIYSFFVVVFIYSSCAESQLLMTFILRFFAFFYNILQYSKQYTNITNNMITA